MTPWPSESRLPVVVAPMFLVSGPEMVLAACRSGVVGAFPTPNARPIAQLGQWMQQITEGLARARDEPRPHPLGPWCANLVTHSSNTRLAQDLELVARFKPPLVVTALGSPAPAMAVVQRYGGRVLADVVNLKLARKAVAAGADGLACICGGAGGHTGFLNPFAFVSAVREFFDGLLVVGGAISDGWGVAGALAAGADAVYMGTRFIAVQESLAVPAYKQMLVEAQMDDLIVSDAITGTPASWLKPSLRAHGLDPDRLPPAPERHYDSHDSGTRQWRDVWAAGQGVGSIRSIQPLSEVVDQIEQEYRLACGRFLQRQARSPS